LCFLAKCCAQINVDFQSIGSGNFLENEAQAGRGFSFVRGPSDAAARKLTRIDSSQGH
jgi:hypothetical protein